MGVLKLFLFLYDASVMSTGLDGLQRRRLRINASQVRSASWCLFLLAPLLRLLLHR